jgi:hypothetical protein
MALTMTHLREALAMAERHLATDNRVVIRQKELISKLAADGHDVTEALALPARYTLLIVICWSPL